MALVRWLLHLFKSIAAGILAGFGFYPGIHSGEGRTLTNVADCDILPMPDCVPPVMSGKLTDLPLVYNLPFHAVPCVLCRDIAMHHNEPEGPLCDLCIFKRDMKRSAERDQVVVTASRILERQWPLVRRLAETLGGGCAVLHAVLADNGLNQTQRMAIHFRLLHYRRLNRFKQTQTAYPENAGKGQTNEPTHGHTAPTGCPAP